MLKNISRLECKVDGKDYFFMCDTDSSTVSAKEALFQFNKYIGQVEDQAKAAQEAAEKSKEPEVLESELIVE